MSRRPSRNPEAHARAGRAVRIIALGVTWIGSVATSQAQVQDRTPDEPVIPGWNIQPAIGVAVSYTDNLFATVGDEVEDIVGQAIPSISIEYNGSRATLDLDYQLQAVYFDEQSDFDRVFNQLIATATVEPVLDHLFIDLNANYFQQVVDPTERLQFNTLVPTTNFTDSEVVAATPRWIQPLGASAEMQLSYGVGYVDYKEPDDADFAPLDDSDFVGAQALLRSPEESGPFSWTAIYNNREVDYEISTDVKFEEAYVQLGLDTSASVRLMGIFGYDSDVETDISAGGLDESRWEVGLRWQGGPSNVLEAYVGERFFGNTYRLNWTYTGRMLYLILDYDEGPTTLTEEEITSPDSFLAQGTVFTIVPLGIEVEPFLQRDGSLTIGLAGARNNLDLTLYAGEQEFIETNDQSRGRRAVLEWERRLGPVMTFAATVDWQRIQIRETQDFFEVWVGTLELERDLSPSLTARLLYSNERRTNDIPENEYRENAISLGLVKRFGGQGGNRQRSVNFTR